MRSGPSRVRRANETGFGPTAFRGTRHGRLSSGRKLSTPTRSTSWLSAKDRITMASISTVWITFGSVPSRLRSRHGWDFDAAAGAGPLRADPGGDHETASH